MHLTTTLTGMRCLRVWLTLAGSLVTPTWCTAPSATGAPPCSLRATPPTPTQVCIMVHFQPKTQTIGPFYYCHGYNIYLDCLNHSTKIVSTFNLDPWNDVTPVFRPHRNVLFYSRNSPLTMKPSIGCSNGGGPWNIPPSEKECKSFILTMSRIVFKPQHW